MANKMGFMPNRWNEPTKVVFNNNYFGDNPGIYNLMELNCAVSNGSSFIGNTFTRGAASHNFINLYQIADGATINIDNNNFDCGPETNPIRIAARDIPDPETGELRAPRDVVVNIRNNTYTGQIEDPEYAGILFFQPFDRLTSDFSGITVNLSGNVTSPDVDQLFYLFLTNKKVASGAFRDTQFMDNPTDTSRFPTVFVNGKKLTDEEMLARVVCWDDVSRSMVSLQEYFGEPEPETPQIEPTDGQ